MASNTGPDLDGARIAVEALMDDTCIVLRPSPEGSETIDPVSLKRVKTPPTQIYDGRCSVGTASRPGQPFENVGGDQRGLAGYSLSLPILQAPELLAGDIVRITSSRRDPQLSGTQFLIDEVAYKTMAISRKAQMTLVT